MEINGQTVNDQVKYADMGLSAEVLRAPIRKTPAAARLAKGSHCIAPKRPTRSANHPVRIGPGASPNALFASVRTAKAVP